MGLLNSDLWYLILSINNLRSPLFRGLQWYNEVAKVSKERKTWTKLSIGIYAHLFVKPPLPAIEHKVHIFSYDFFYLLEGFTFTHLAEAFIQSQLHLIS